MNTAICVTPFEDMGMTVSKNKIVIKLGGGLITDKSQYKVVHEDRIDLVCVSTIRYREIPTMASITIG